MGHWDQGCRKLDGHWTEMESVVDLWCSTGAPRLVRHYQVVVTQGMHIWNIWWVLWWLVAHVQLLVPKSVTWRCIQPQGGRGWWLCSLFGSGGCCLALGNPSSRSFCLHWSVPGGRGERWQFTHPTFEITGKSYGPSITQSAWVWEFRYPQLQFNLISRSDLPLTLVVHHNYICPTKAQLCSCWYMNITI